MLRASNLIFFMTLLASSPAMHQSLQGQLGAGVRVAAQPLRATWGVHAARLALQPRAHGAAAAAGLSDQLGAMPVGLAGGLGPDGGQGRRGPAGGQTLGGAGRAAEQHLGAHPATAARSQH